MLNCSRLLIIILFEISSFTALGMQIPPSLYEKCVTGGFEKKPIKDIVHSEAQASTVQQDGEQKHF